MSIVQFLRIFWARWLTIVIVMVSSAFGAYVVSKLVQPRYEAVARVMLNVGKPDPVTGAVITPAGAKSFGDTQRELVKDDRVAGRVADALRWETDPNLIRAYQGRPPSDNRDFRRWLAGRASDNTDVAIQGTVMRIVYHAPSAMEAKIAAETLRTAYLEQALADKRAEARKNAEWFNQRAEVARTAAEAAERAKAAYEKESGIVLTSDNTDADSARLAALAGQLGAAAAGPAGPSAASLQLAEIESIIAQETQRLGPNHPRMVELNRRRQQLAEMARQERAAASGGAAATAAIGQALQDQKARVVGQRDKVERLRQLQSEVDLKRDEYKRTAARAAELSLEAAMANSQATPLGVVLAPTSPVFPKKSLMVGGATALGFGLGMALALLLELLNRRVRGVEDLDVAADVRCIGVITEPARARARRFGLGRIRFGRRRVAGAPA